MNNNLPKPIVLIILDGWGLAPNSPGNAITKANTPNINKFWNVYPHTKLIASGESVGLPRGEPGNSETGHLNLGAGSIIYQSLPSINMSIADGSFFSSNVLKQAAKHVHQYQSAMHFIGLIGNGGVHSNIEHLFALMQWAKRENLKRVFLHLFTDGRDSPPAACLQYLKMVEENCQSYDLGSLATIMGRFYAMDRDNRWERIKVAYEALVDAKGLKTDNYQKAIELSYQKGITDEFIKPIILMKYNQPVSRINDNDAVIFFNFRVDRPRELTKAFVLPDFENYELKKPIFDPYAELYGKKQYQEVGKITTFNRQKTLKNLLFVTMTEYEPGLPVLNIFPPSQIKLPLARILAEDGWRQLHMAETEKERHVTYYFNGKREEPFPGEDRKIIPSPNIKTYDLMPEMSAIELTNKLLERIQLNTYDFIIINFANPDMVGHTGVLEAGIKACETIDLCLGRIVNLVLAINGICLITADHGNVEEMIDLNTQEVDTKHSSNPVPFILAGKKLNSVPSLLKQGILADISPTILKIANVNKPTSMTGSSLI